MIFGTVGATNDAVVVPAKKPPLTRDPLSTQHVFKSPGAVFVRLSLHSPALGGLFGVRDALLDNGKLFVPAQILSSTMWILPLLGFVGLALGFAFMTLSIASGLYYLSELVEEHTVLSSKLLTRLIYAVIIVQTLLWLVDGFPFTLTCLGVASHIVYASNLRHFPIVKFSDPLFLLSCALVGLNHWVWFRHFSDLSPYDSRPAYRDIYQSPAPQPSFTEVSSYFGICVWLVPFAFFVSLSAGENVLPSMGSEYATGDRVGVGTKGHKRRNTGIAKAAVSNVKEWVGETGAVMGMWQKDNVRSSD